jgi:phosphate transport system protein
MMSGRGTTACWRRGRLRRDRYHEGLDAVPVQLVELAVMVTNAMGRATTAVVSGDLGAAEEVISQDAVIDTVRDDIEARVVSLLACQQPVATDLRTLVATLRISADLERMGDLSGHVAEIARRRCPGTPSPLCSGRPSRRWAGSRNRWRPR